MKEEQNAKQFLLQSHQQIENQFDQYTLKNKKIFTIFFSQLNKVIKNVKGNISSKELASILNQSNFLPDYLMLQVQAALKRYFYSFFIIIGRTDLKVITMLKNFAGKQFISIGGLKGVSIFFLFSIPLIMNILTNEIRKLNEEQLNISKGIIILYSVLMLIATFLSAITDTQYSYQIIQLEIKCRHFLIETLYQSAMSRKANQPIKSNLDLINLVTIDVNTILNFFLSFHECWSLILKLIIGLVMLYVQMSQAIFIGFTIAVFLMIINFYIAKMIGKYFALGMSEKDKRMFLLKEFVQSPKQIKYLKWESKWHKDVIKIRNKEFKLIQYTKWLDSLCVLFWAITNTLISTGTLIYFGSDLQQENIFTMIYLFSLITAPLNSLPWTVSGMLQARHSFKRINQYLLSIREFNQFQDQLNNEYQEYQVFKLEYKDTQFSWYKQVEQEISLNKIEPINKQIVLNIESLKIEPFTLNFVIGPTNAGKTSFLNTLLNELNLEKGQFVKNFSGPISYVPQVHWISQTTIRKNILMEEERNLDFERYIQTLECSQLYQDIIEQQELDMFDVGPEGQKLSGGQKQRVSICRALYQDSILYVLDDIFSSLDPQVADKVFMKGIIDYLKQRLNKTIILSLNDGYVGRYLKYGDKNILIKDGVVTDDQEEIQEYVKSIDNNVQLEDVEIEDKVQLKQILQEKPEKQQENPLIDNLDNNRKTMESVKFYLQELGLVNTMLIGITLILMQFSFNLYDGWLNSYLNGTPLFLISNNFISTLIFLTVMDILAKSARAFTFAYGNLYQASQIFDKLLFKVIYGQAKLFDKEDSGQILSRLSGDQNVVDILFPFELNLVCNNVVNFIGTFILLVIVEWLLIFPTALAIYLFKQVQDLYRPTSLPFRRLDAQVTAEMLTLLNDHSKGVQIIVAHQKSLIFYNQFFESLTDMLRINWASKCIGLWLQIRLQLVAGLMVFSILLICILQLYYPAISLAPSTLQLLLYYSLTKISLFRDLTLSLTTVERELIAYERIRKYMDYEIDNVNYNTSSVFFKYELIRFEDVWLDYGDEFNHIYALKGISFTINQGQMIAFCGRTGSGKSSILSLIFQLYPISQGKIAFKYSNMRQKISVIPQNGLVFKGTVLSNLGGPDYLNELSKILENCPIEIDLNQELESDGKNISQGKRQVISFIRVLLENNEIICLDEATASVDNAIEDWVIDIKTEFNQIIETLERMSKEEGKTVITVSHKLEKLRNYDKIFYLEDGSIREQGNWESLTKETNSKFNQLRNLIDEK